MMHAPIRLMTLIPFLVLALCVVPASAQDAPTPATAEQLKAEAEQRKLARTQAAEQDLWTRQNVTRFENRVKEASDLFAELERRHTSLTEWMSSLLTSDDGKRLGLNPTVAIQFVAYQEQPVMRLADFDANRGYLAELENFLKESQASPQVGYVPDAERVREADDAYLWARDRLARVAETEAWLKTSLATADLDADVSEMPTLEELIQNYLARRHQLWVENTVEGKRIAAEQVAPEIKENARQVELERALFETEQLLREATQALEKQRLDFDRKLREQDAIIKERAAAAEREYAERIAEIDRLNRLAEAARKQRDVESIIEAQEIDDEAQRMLLVAKCRSASVQRDLRPFLDEGTWQPGDKGPNVRFDAEPISHKALLELGALEETIDGVKRLLIVANAKGVSDLNGLLYGIKSGRGHPDKERTKWGYNVYFHKLTQDQVNEVRRIQAQLIELGPTLVEEGMLAP